MVTGLNNGIRVIVMCQRLGMTIFSTNTPNWAGIEV